MIATNSQIQNVLGRLKGVKQVSGGYVACCPAHDDKHPSLSVTEKDGKVLLEHFKISYMLRSHKI